MTLAQGKRWYIVWSWPRGGMSWFFWSWRAMNTFPEIKGWRIGPLTLSVRDVEQNVTGDQLTYNNGP
jgi:hypothetical protein